MKSIDRKILIALSAPTGFAITFTFFYYCLKFFSVVFKGQASTPAAELATFIIIILFAAVLGSYLGPKLAQRLLKVEIPFVKLAVGSVVGYALGIALEVALFIRQSPAVFKSIIYPAVIVVLLCGYLGALIGMGLPKRKTEGA